MAEETYRSAPLDAAGEEATAQPTAAASRDAAGDAPSAVGAIAANAAADPPTTPTPKHNDIAQLLDFAGGRKPLTYVGLRAQRPYRMLRRASCPYVCIWLVARDLIEVAPDWQAAATGIAAYGWWAYRRARSASHRGSTSLALMCTHLAAFRCGVEHAQANHRAPHAPARLGYFDAHATGEPCAA